MTDTLQTLMREATRLTRAGDLGAATAAIQRALAGASAGRAEPAGRAAPPSGATTEGPEVLDGLVREAPAAGAFTQGSHRHGGLTRDYKLYLPPGTADRPPALVVMLHGCTQDPDDFAAGTAMNRHAAEQGFAVLYPAQSTQANPSKCWNWFKHNHQQRDRGEPALIAALTSSVCRLHALDADRVYIAGLSAGGAMAAVVAAAYPDLYAAVGVHSGLAPGVARNLPDALAAMQGGVPVQAANRPGPGPLHRRPARAATAIAVPTIVFHGDQDTTVHPRNGEQVLAAVQAAGAGSPQRRIEQGLSAGGRRYTRAMHHAPDGRTIAEHWVVHGAGHAWSGGQAAGSYTDGAGPDATHEMLRFFMTHRRGTPR